MLALAFLEESRLKAILVQTLICIPDFILASGPDRRAWLRRPLNRRRRRRTAGLVPRGVGGACALAAPRSPFTIATTVLGLVGSGAA